MHIMIFATFVPDEKYQVFNQFKNNFEFLKLFCIDIFSDKFLKFIVV